MHVTVAASPSERSDGPSGDRRHTEHGRERKQQLIDAAAELFAANGYAATRIEDICRRAGVAKGLFYWYFPTKQELFAELVRTMRTRLRKAQAAAMDADADPLTRTAKDNDRGERSQCQHAEIAPPRSGDSASFWSERACRPLRGCSLSGIESGISN